MTKKIIIVIILSLLVLVAIGIKIRTSHPKVNQLPNLDCLAPSPDCTTNDGSISFECSPPYIGAYCVPKDLCQKSGGVWLETKACTYGKTQGNETRRMEICKAMGGTYSRGYKSTPGQFGPLDATPTTICQIKL